MAHENLTRVEVASRRQWRKWLAANHTSDSAVWVVYHRKVTGKKHVPVGHLVEEALCFGWIDSLPRKLDDERTMLMFSPRRKGSVWSAINKERVAKLVAAGLMQEAGLRKVEQAKADGMWEYLEDIDAMLLPEDLAAALAGAGMAGGYDALPPYMKRGMLLHVKSAKTAATRERRIAEVLRMVGARGKK